MRALVMTVAAFVLAAGAAEAKDMKSCAADWAAMKKAGTTGSQTYKQFSQTCMSAGSPGVAPASPSTPAVHPAITAATGVKSAGLTAGAAQPAGATAKCKDGSYSMSKHHSGSCSRHGGVAQFL